MMVAPGIVLWAALERGETLFLKGGHWPESFEHHPDYAVLRF